MSSITLSQADYDALMALVAKSKEARQEIKRLCTLGRPLGRWDFQTALFGSLFNAIDAVEDVKPLGSVLLPSASQPIMYQDDKINPDMIKSIKTLPAGTHTLSFPEKPNAKRNADKPRTTATKSRPKRSTT